MGKGSRPRPLSVPYRVWSRKYDIIFGNAICPDCGRRLTLVKSVSGDVIKCYNRECNYEETLDSSDK